MVLKAFYPPYRILLLREIFRKNVAISILDIGAGNNSASITKHYFPNSKYYGLDIDPDCNYSPEDFKLMEKFYEKDLTKLEFDDIPNDFFDVIIMSHVIEHLHNGDSVLDALSSKLKGKGVIYIEFPGSRSLSLPSKPINLNFYDDPTHVRLYSVGELVDVLKSRNFEILESGIRKSWSQILIMPVKIMYQLLTKRKVMGTAVWDIVGFAEFIYARKK